MGKRNIPDGSSGADEYQQVKSKRQKLKEHSPRLKEKRAVMPPLGLSPVAGVT